MQALPGGNRNNNGNFNNLGNNANFWSSTEYSSTIAWYRNLYYNNAYMCRDGSYKTDGFSGRRLKLMCAMSAKRRMEHTIQSKAHNCCNVDR